MHILIFGASGHVGTGLARHLSASHRITGVVRSQPVARAPYAPVLVPDWVDRPRSVIDELTRTDAQRVDAVIAAVGGWYVDEAMIDRGIASFDKDYSSYLRSHFAACAVTQALADSGTRTEAGARADAGASAEADRSAESEASAEADRSAESEASAEAGRSEQIRHLTLNGVASVEACVGSGAISVFGAAQEMLLRVAAAESRSVLFRELKVMAPIGGDDRNDLSGGVETIGMSAVADAAGEVLSRPGDFELTTQLKV
ncbi:NAD(P)-dependent oxidoreductase [Brevibacterium marinum]|uniref:Uncharacterized protein n=1 Tax=Brevibacterium marinum TaxID=418643 RepID=A0A846S2J6_9MICO|nr:NAD(P)-dependent oxidoreductase [Brevibacterium marinum]NJC57248.1 hypothetical protein [Brevibacterium marinum]